MKLEELTVKEINPSEERMKIFDTYTRAYNSVDEFQRINFTANLTALRDGYEKQVIDLDKHIQNNLKILANHLMRINKVEYKNYLVDGVPTLIPTPKFKKDESLEGFIKNLNGILENEINILKYGHNYGLDDLINSLQSLQENLKDSHKLNSSFFELLQDTLNLAAQFFLIQNHAGILSFLIREIGVNNYSIDLTTWSELAENEKPDLLEELDKKPGHIHRKPQIIEQYKSIQKKCPSLPETEILNQVQAWYFELTKKDINEGTIRYYLGAK